ncbi:MAG TPA: hypothetical protein VF218_04560 [Acidothermaceae bacterium]
MERGGRASARWVGSWPLFAIGGIGVIAGGLVAAATAPSPTEHGSWAAAYLVLVVGVAQVALGAGQLALCEGTPSTRLVGLEAAGWNVGNALVIAGTLAGNAAAVYAGGALLVVALATFTHGVRRSPALSRGGRLLLYAFRTLVLLLLVSIPTGLVLATIRGGS